MVGRRNDRHFRVLVVEHTTGPKSGKYVEKVGFINPRTHESKLDIERVKYWLSVGAQPSDRVYNMLVDEGVLDGPKKNVLPKKSPIVKEGEESEEGAEQSASTENEGDSSEGESSPSEEAESAEEENTEKPEEAPAE